MSALLQRANSLMMSRRASLGLTAAKFILLGPFIAIAGGRWGSYLGIPGTPVYFADLAVGIGVVLYIASSADRKAAPLNNEIAPLPLRLKVGIFCFSVVLGLGVFASPGASIYAVRDSLPFVYFLLVPLFYRAVETIGRERAFRWLRNAALLHLAWFAPAVFHVLPEVQVPLIGGIPAFTTRGDFDLLICGLALVVVAMDTTLNGVARWLLGIIAALAALSSGSRAGLIGAVIMVACVILFQRPFGDPKRGAFRLSVAALAVAPTSFLVVILSNSPPEWAIGLQRLLPSNTSVYESGQNTWNARLDAWKLLSDYSAHNASGGWFGSGFGGNPVLESGALNYLSGDPSVRAAHNFLVTWYAMTGAIGLLFILTAMIGWTALALRRAWRSKGVNAIGIGLVMGLISAGMAGVILESPFGYMALALAIAYAVQPPPEGLPKPVSSQGPLRPPRAA